MDLTSLALLPFTLLANSLHYSHSTRPLSSTCRCSRRLLRRMPSTISPSESFSLSNRAFEQINHDQTLSARSTDYFDTSTTGYRTVEKAPATSFQRGAVVVAEDRGVSHESDHRQRVEGFPLSKRSAQILPPIFYSVVPAPPSAQSSPLSTPSSTPSLSSTKSDDSVPSLESLASSPPPTPPTSSQPGPPDEYLDELLHLRYEASRRAIETVQADFLASLLKRTITYPLSTSLPNPSRPSSPTSIAKQPTSVILLQEIADRLRELTLCSSAAILDTRAFHCPPMGGTARPSLHRRDSEEEREDSDPDELSSKTRTGTGKIALMGVSGDVDWRQALSQGKVGKEVCEALRRFSAVSFSSSAFAPRRCPRHADSSLCAGRGYSIQSLFIRVPLHDHPRRRHYSNAHCSARRGRPHPSDALHPLVL